MLNDKKRVNLLCEKMLNYANNNRKKQYIYEKNQVIISDTGAVGSDWGDASYLDNWKSSTIRPPIPIPTVRPLRPISICKAVVFRVFPLAKAFTSAKAERYYSDNLLPIEDLTCQSAKQPWEYQILPFSFFLSYSS